MVRKMRKPKNQRRIHQKPTTDYGYLNQELIDLMDTYVLQFESINPNQQKITSDYANDLKNQLASKTIAEVKDITDYAQYFSGLEDPHKEIIFTDGSRISLPTSMIQKASIKEQQRKEYMARVDKNKDGKISPLELQQGQSPSRLRESNAESMDLEVMLNEAMQNQQELQNELQNRLPGESSDIVDDPNIETVPDGNYLYTLVDGEPTKITNLNTGKIIDKDEITQKAREVILEKYEESKTTTSIPEEETEPIPKEVTEFDQSKASRIQPIKSEGLKNLNETIAKEQPEKLKNLGQKVKKGYEGLTKEQKAMGLLMGLDVGLEAVNYLGPARKEAMDRIEILEDRRERGQLGVDERQDAETMKYMTRPVRAMAEESEREQQAVMAGMGETRSAADLRRLRESRDAQMTDALSRAGQEVARQQMARKEAEKRELNQLQAYQQENLRNLTNRISGSVAQMAGTFGANVAAEADLQKELSPDTIDKYTKIIMDSDPNLTEEEARRMATDYGMGRAKKKVDYAQYLTGVRNPPEF
tara:strand:- start:405 stop:1997 length:1593 start_codon:yes stop_codon:yes gene_type:complete